MDWAGYTYNHVFIGGKQEKYSLGQVSNQHPHVSLFMLYIFT